MNEQRYLTKSSCALAAIVFGLLLGRGDAAAAQQPGARFVGRVPDRAGEQARRRARCRDRQYREL